MNSPSNPEVSSEVILSRMNAVVYSIFCTGASGYEDIFPKPTPTARPRFDSLDLKRAGVAYDETTMVGKGKKAVDFFTTAFFGPEPANSTGLVLLRQVTEEFTGTEGQAVTIDFPPDFRNVPGKIKGKLLYYISEPPPEVIRERNFILYSYVGNVIIRARYLVGDEEKTVGHSLLTFSRNAYSPEGGLPLVRLGVPTRNFKWAEA